MDSRRSRGGWERSDRVYLIYADEAGHAFIDRSLYRPNDPGAPGDHALLVRRSMSTVTSRSIAATPLPRCRWPLCHVASPKTVSGHAVDAVLTERFETAAAVAETYRVHIRAGRTQESAAHAPGTREHIIVLAGTARVGETSAPALVGPGMHGGWAADVPHLYEAPSRDGGSADRALSPVKPHPDPQRAVHGPRRPTGGRNGNARRPSRFVGVRTAADQVGPEIRGRTRGTVTAPCNPQVSTPTNIKRNLRLQTVVVYRSVQRDRDRSGTARPTVRRAQDGTVAVGRRPGRSHPRCPLRHRRPAELSQRRRRLTEPVGDRRTDRLIEPGP